MNLSTRMKLFITVIIYLISNIELFSQDQEYIFSNITRNALLSQHYVSAIIEDDNGIMWFGTHDGLNYFDGYNFKRFSVNKQNKNSISSNSINALAKDEQGNLWIGTNNGLNKLNLKTETFTLFRNNTSGNSVNDNLIVDVKYDKKGYIWYATKYAGLYRLDLKTNQINEFLRNKPHYNFNFLENIKEIELDNDGDIWILYETKGIVNYNPESEEIKIFSTATSGGKITSDLVNTIAITKDNLVIIAIRKLGLISINKNDFSINLDFLGEKNYNRYLKEVNNSNINDILIYKDGTIFFDNSYLGILKYNSWNNKLSFPSEFIYNAQDSLDKYITRLYLDSKDNIWIGSAGFGIGLISKNIKPFINYSSEIENSKFRLSFPSVRGIYEDSNGDVYVGGYNGFNKIDKVTGEIFVLLNKPTYLVREDLFGSDEFLTISFESFDFGGTLYRFNKRDKSYKRIFREIPATFARCFLLDSKNELWIGMMRGLFKYDFNSEKLTLVQNEFIDFSSETINQIFEDKQDNIWIATRGKGIIFLTEKIAHGKTLLMKHRIQTA